MRLYADASWWLAYKCRRDVHHAAAISLFDREPEALALWTPWQRVEVFNSFYQAERAGHVRQGEARQMMRLLEQEIRLGYWPHVEFGWTDAVRTACNLAAQHSLGMTVRAMDLFHVAIAIEVGAEAFLSFDEEQMTLAEVAGLTLIRLGATTS